MSEEIHPSRLVYVLPRVRVSSRMYREKSVAVGKAQFWPDEPATWNNILKLPRPDWLDIFREFPGTERSKPLPARGTLLVADDDAWLRQSVSRAVAVLFAMGVDENRWEVPAEAFQYHGFRATAKPADLVTLYTKTGGKTEDLRSLQLLPPLELRGVTSHFRVPTQDDLNRELVRRFDANPNDRMAVACYHLFRTQFDNTFLSPAEQDYAGYCACLEAALDLKGPDYGKEMADRLIAMYPNFPEIERWVKGLYSERSVFNHGATVEEADAAKDDRAKALFEFRGGKLNWDVLRHLCLDVIRDQLHESLDSKGRELRRMMYSSRELLAKLFGSEELWREIAKTFTQKEAVKRIMALSGDEQDEFLELCCAFLNGHHWQVIREKVEAKKVFDTLKAMAAVIGESSPDQADKDAAEALFQAAKKKDQDAVDLWARHHAGWEGGAVFENKSLAAKAVAVRTARFFMK